VKEGSKYQPLLEFLRGSNQSEVILTFAEIEALMNDPLPDSAKSKRAWWSNRTKGALQASAWMEAGYRVEDVDLDGQRVTFRKPTTDYQVQRVGDTMLWNSELIKALRLHMGLTQVEFAERLGVRQKTVSNWEIGLYEPTRSTSKHLELVAEIAGFRYEEESENSE
jgi:DNA-binding transcriptional regulator YiaG